VNRYRIPVDITLYAETAEDAERHVQVFMRAAHRDIGPQYNMQGYTFPAGYPVEKDE